MPTTPDNFKEVRIVVPEVVYNRLDELRGDHSVRTMQSLLAPVISAFSRGEIVQMYLQGPKLGGS